MTLRSSIRALSRKLQRRRLRLLSRMKGPEFRYVIRLFNYTVRLSLGEQIQMEIAVGNFEPEEAGWVEDLLRPGMVFVDVGANIGYFSLLAASRVGPAGKVIAFEPSPYCQQRLEEVVRENAIRQMVIEPTGLGDKPGRLDLVVEHMSLHSPSFLAKSGDCSYSVPVTTLDAYMEQSNISYVDIMKIDVEGFEPNVLKGAERSLQQGKFGALLIELNEIWLGRNSWSADNLDKLIKSYGFVPLNSTEYDYHKNVLYIKK